MKPAATVKPSASMEATATSCAGVEIAADHEDGDQEDKRAKMGASLMHCV